MTTPPSDDIKNSRQGSLDHIVAEARGGTNHKENFQLLCGNCNSRKGAMSQEAFMEIMSQEKTSFDWL